MKARYLLVALAALSLAACTPKEDVVDGVLQVSGATNNEVVFSIAGETKTVTVKSNVSWTATCDADWLTVDPKEGTNTDGEVHISRIKITAEKASVDEAREAKLTISAEGVSDVVLTLKQDKYTEFTATVLTMSVTDFNPEYLSQYPDETSIGVVVGLPTSEVVSGFYGLWESYMWENEIADWEGNLEGTIADVQEFGMAMPDNMVSKINDPESGFATIFYGLDPDTEYIFIALLTDAAGRNYVGYGVTKTKAFPYYGFLNLGDYLLTDGEGEEMGSTVLNVNYAGVENKYIVKNPVVADGSSWNATYNPEAKTLTLDGTAPGLEEEYGNFFGSVVYGPLDATTYYMYASYAAGLEENGTASVVYSVDENGSLSKLNNYRFGILALQPGEDDKLSAVGWAMWFDGATTTIAPYVEAEQSSVKAEKKFKSVKNCLGNLSL